MADIHQDILQFFRGWKPTGAAEIETLPLSGSNRQYLRVHHGGQHFIATYNPSNIPENNAFIEFSKHFQRKQLPVPEILHVHPDRTMYLQTDLGDVSLFQIMQSEGFSEHVFGLFKKTLTQLARLQIEGGQNLDYNHCIATKSFDKQAIYSDLLYFLYYFVRALDLPRVLVQALVWRVRLRLVRALELALELARVLARALVWRVRQRLARGLVWLVRARA